MRERPALTKWPRLAACVVAGCVCLLCGEARAQDAGPGDASCAAPHRPHIAGLEVVGNNLGVFAYHKIRGDEAYGIGFASWSRNFQEGPNWDTNPFSVNQFSHPLHGALYFASARSHGVGFLGASAFSAAGSGIWEFLMETHRPSINDLVSTSLGGMAMGEATHRLSEAVLARRGERGGFLAAVAGFVLNPVTGVHELLAGPRPGACGLPPRLEGVLRAGVRRLGPGLDSAGPRVDPIFSITLRYGDPFAGDVRRPFDSFELSAQLTFDTGNPVGRLEIAGILLGHAFGEPGRSRLVLGAFQHMDFINDDGGEFGSQSFGLGARARVGGPDGLELRASVDAVGLALAAVRYEHARWGPRNYDYGPGVGAKAGLALRVADHQLLTVRYGGYRVDTMNGSDARHLTHLASAALEVPLFRPLGVGVDYEILARRTESERHGASSRHQTRLKTYGFVRILP